MRRCLLAILTLLGLCGIAAGQVRAPAGRVLLIDIKGAIGVAAVKQLESALEQAAQEQAGLLVIRLDTPGGLVSSTRDMIQAILSSQVPVAVYIAPSGARAASAGTYIAYAAHVSAMAPGTHLGAATPVQLGGAPGMPEPQRREGEARREGESAMERKVLNDAVAYIRTLAQLRGRNADWAEKAVRDASTLTADDAARDKVVDLLATDLNALLTQIDGRKVQVGGRDVTLATRGREIATIETNWRTRLIGAIADPNVALILMMIGFYGILFEFWHPGTAAPGVIGGICLLLAFAALSVLPVSWAGLALLLLGLGLMAAEAFTPGLGILGIGGLVSFVLGAVFLIDPTDTDIDLRVAWPTIVGSAATTALFLTVVMGFALRARRRPVVSGAEEMIGLEGRVIAWNGPSGTVRVHGEMWAARGAGDLAAGDPVRVVSRDGLTLEIRRAQGEAP